MGQKNQRGSVVTYILIALFLVGLLLAALSQGANKTADSSQLDEMMLYLQLDLKTIHTAANECIQTYSDAVDVDGDGTIDADDNPNPLFPLYGTGARATLTSGTTGAETTTDTGTAIANIGCPGSPNANTAVFSGDQKNIFKILGDTATYTTTYFNNGGAASTEGVYIRITRANADPLWTEAISRLNNKYSACSAAAVTAGGTCANGCFYYWILRRSTSVLGGEVGCP